MMAQCNLTLQVVIDNDKPAFGKLENVSTGAAVKLTGKLGSFTW